MYISSGLNTVSSSYGQQKGNQMKTPASGEKTFYTAETPKVYQIFTTDNMLWTGGNGTGLSYCLKYADDSTDENPVVLAKGVDENGKEFEKLDIRVGTVLECENVPKMKKLLKFKIAGDISMDDVDFSTHKLLKNDMEAVTELKKKPYDDFSLKYWNLDSDLAKGNLPRLVAIMVGDAPLVNEEYVPVYNAYNGQTETMEAKWANLKKMEEETFAKIIMGKADISEFDTFVKNWQNQGGDQILKEINDELSK